MKGRKSSGFCHNVAGQTHNTYQRKGYRKFHNRWNACNTWYEFWVSPFKKYFERTLLIPLGGQRENSLSGWVCVKAKEAGPNRDPGIGHDLWETSRELTPFLESGKVSCEVLHRNPLYPHHVKRIKDVPFRRAMWGERVTYKCEFESLDTCHDLKRMGKQKSKKCTSKIEDKCAVFEHVFEVIKKVDEEDTHAH